jgi:hypothetical protein
MDEISTVLKEIPLDKSPGPNGFNMPLHEEIMGYYQK